LEKVFKKKKKKKKILDIKISLGKVQEGRGKG
jgi:hypothetical protein